MPNVQYAPHPMVDPYAGQAGKLIGELVSNIGQIYKLRQQRNQTDAILDIMKNPNPNLSPEEQRKEQQNAIIEVARTGGDVLRNELARIYTADLFMPEMERRQSQAQTEYLESRAKYYREGGAGGKTVPLSHAAMESYQKTMESYIDNAYKGHKLGKPNYPQGSLLAEFQKYKVHIGFDDMPYNQQQQIMHAWNTKLKARGGEYEWNQENPNVVAAGSSNTMQNISEQWLKPAEEEPEAKAPRKPFTKLPKAGEIKGSEMGLSEFGGFGTVGLPYTGEKGKIEDEFAGYMDKLDDESKDELRQIIEEYTEAENKDRTKINTALQMLRDRYGNLR